MRAAGGAQPSPSSSQGAALGSHHLWGRDRAGTGIPHTRACVCVHVTWACVGVSALRHTDPHASGVSMV